jgi:hypothetical protein
MNKCLGTMVLLTLLMSASASASAERFTTIVSGTVSDTYTALMWQRDVSGESRSWKNALAYCEGLTLGGFTDWRLPNTKELRSLMDDNHGYSLTHFPSPPGPTSVSFWTSTSREGSPNFAWYIIYPGGVLYTSMKLDSLWARCVR